jgi:phage shock protein E
MKKFQQWLPLFALVLILALASCSASTTAPAAPVVDEPVAAAAVLEDLPQTVDVQTVYEIKDNPDVYLIDVREQYEYDEKHIPDINLLPMSTIENRLDEIPSNQTVIVTCRTGNRSGQVTDFLRANGFDNVHNMSGGIVAWEEAGFPVE